MKYSNHNNMNNFKNESQYDELESSIVDSLSEISIASNLPITIHNQTYLNNTISEVVSLYLWSTNLSSRKIKKKRSRMNIDLDKLSREDNKQMFGDDDEYKRNSPKSVPSKRSSSSLSNLAKEDNKNNSSRVLIPSLDFSSLDTGKRETENKKPGIMKQPGKSSSDLQKSKTGSSINNQEKTVKDEIENLLKELKLNKYQSSDVNDYYDHDHEHKLSKTEIDKLHLMASNLKDLLSRLLEKRKNAKRNMTVDKMTREEIQSEKIDTQKELLTFEEKHGRPISKLEKDLMRPLYDHYRKVKRLITKPSSGKSKEIEQLDEGDDEDNFKDNKHFVNLHSLNWSELLKEKEMVLQEKNKLKDKIKNFEVEFTKQTGRPLTKEDRDLHKEDFERYKVLKAKIKLVEALLEKFESSKK